MNPTDLHHCRHPSSPPQNSQDSGYNSDDQDKNEFGASISQENSYKGECKQLYEKEDNSIQFLLLAMAHGLKQPDKQRCAQLGEARYSNVKNPQSVHPTKEHLHSEMVCRTAKKGKTLKNKSLKKTQYQDWLNANPIKSSVDVPWLLREENNFYDTLVGGWFERK